MSYMVRCTRPLRVDAALKPDQIRIVIDAVSAGSHQAALPIMTVTKSGFRRGVRFAGTAPADLAVGLLDLGSGFSERVLGVGTGPNRGIPVGSVRRATRRGPGRPGAEVRLSGWWCPRRRQPRWRRRRVLRAGRECRSGGTGRGGGGRTFSPITIRSIRPVDRAESARRPGDWR